MTHDYRAVVVTEDYLADLCGEPAADPDPNYHRPGDTVVRSGGVP